MIVHHPTDPCISNTCSGNDVGMGGQRRYRRSVDGYEIPTGGRRQDMDDAVTKILDDVRRTGYGGIYSADGNRRGPLDDPLLAPLLEGPDRIRRGQRAAGDDTILAARPDESFADVQDRVFRSRHYASPRMVTRSRIADAFYAAIGHTVLVPISPERVEAAIDQAHAAITNGEWPRSMLAYHCQGLREWLGLPAGEWTDAEDQAAERGRQLCGTSPPQPQRRPKRPEYDDNRWAL